MGYKKSRVNLFFFFWSKEFAFLQVMDRNEKHWEGGRAL